MQNGMKERAPKMYMGQNVKEDFSLGDYLLEICKDILKPSQMDRWSKT